MHEWKNEWMNGRMNAWMHENPNVWTAAEKLLSQYLIYCFFKSGSSEDFPQSTVAFKRQSRDIFTGKRNMIWVPFKSPTSLTRLVFLLPRTWPLPPWLRELRKGCERFHPNCCVFTATNPLLVTPSRDDCDPHLPPHESHLGTHEGWGERGVLTQAPEPRKHRWRAWQSGLSRTRTESIPMLHHHQLSDKCARSPRPQSSCAAQFSPCYGMNNYIAHRIVLPTKQSVLPMSRGAQQQ